MQNPLDNYHTIRQIAEAGIASHTKIYALIALGKLKAVKFGRRTLVTNLNEYLAALEPAKITMPSNPSVKAAKLKLQRKPRERLDDLPE